MGCLCICNEIRSRKVNGQQQRTGNWGKFSHPTDGNRDEWVRSSEWFSMNRWTTTLIWCATTKWPMKYSCDSTLSVDWGRPFCRCRLPKLNENKRIDWSKLTTLIIIYESQGLESWSETWTANGSTDSQLANETWAELGGAFTFFFLFSPSHSSFSLSVPFEEHSVCRISVGQSCSDGGRDGRVGRNIFPREMKQTRDTRTMPPSSRPIRPPEVLVDDTVGGNKNKKQK